MNKLEELAEHWEQQCNRYVNGYCSNAACLRRGGYVGCAPVDYSIATCREHETAASLRARSMKEGSQ